jgi:hypothetical protein
MAICDQPEVKLPDYAQAAREGVYANLESYPTSYMVNAAARLGIPLTIGGKTYDFTGLGDVETSAAMSDQMAQVLLDLQRTRGPEVIRQRIEELKAADPQGYAARKQLFDAIVADAERSPNRPMAQQLQSTIMSELQKEGKLDARAQQQVRNSVRGRQVASGITLGNAPVLEEASAMVRAGESARDMRQQQANTFLQSGVSPEDVEYRRLQQALSNYGSFINGSTPSAQFGGLSSAGNGAVPFMGGGYNQVQQNPNAAAQGANWESNIYSRSSNWQNQQVSPYLAGFSGMMAAAPGAASAVRK